jgi:DNA-binding LytR/AlgR family response regulator
MNVIIIEDEELAAQRLTRMIHEIDSKINVLATLESIEDAVIWFANNKEPDLIFLDIHLEDGLSFAIFENVKISAPIIFTTAYDEYAIKAFKLKSIDYLLKPISSVELAAAIDKYKDWNKQATHIIDPAMLYGLFSPKEKEYKTRFAVSIGQKIKSVPIEEVAYFFSDDGITFLTTKSKCNYTLDQSLDQLGELVNPKEFFRVNRAFLVKLQSIANVHVFPKSRLKLDLQPTPQKEVYVSIDKVTKFKEWLDN